MTAAPGAAPGVAPPSAPAIDDATRAAFAADVRAGLTATPRTLPSRWLYDAVGSALFEAICALDEYPLTRAEERILARHAADLAALAPRAPIVVELGAGSGRKTRRIVEAVAAHAAAPAALAAPAAPIAYRPIDVSAAALAACARALAPIAEVAPVEDDYLPGLARAVADRGDRPALVLFLGSTIGNFARADALALVRGVRAALRPGDAFLLAADLVKPIDRLVLAYDDPAGVTAAFDLNLLARLRRDLDAEVDVRAFRHEARWHAGERRIEMHLVATRATVVRVAAAGVEVGFAPGESIWTESCHKWSAAELAALGERAGFRHAAQWRDDAWPFAESLFVAV